MINKYKFIIMYLFLVILSIFFYFNKGIVLNYIQNIYSYKKVDDLKNKTIVKLNISGYNYTGLQLLKYDKLNFSILDNKSVNYSGYITYKYLYNLGNKFLLDAYKDSIEGNSGYIEKLKKSITLYKKSLKLAPSYVSKKYILNNLYDSNNLLNFFYVYKCDSLFFSMLGNLQELFSYLNDINNILKKQLGALNKWDKYKFISKCIKGFKKDSNDNILNIYGNELFFKKVNLGLLDLLKQYQDDEYICYQNSKIIKSKYEESINSSLKYFKEFKKTQGDLLLIFQKASITQIVKLCNGKNKLADKQNNKNKKMKNNFDKLKDLFKQKEQKNKKPLSKKKNNKLNKNYDKLNKSTKNKINSLNKQNKDLIKQIEKLKTSNNYSSLNYLDKLFKTFFGDKKVFINNGDINIGK